MAQLTRGNSGTLVVSGTADRVAIFNSDGELVSGNTTTDQLSYLDNTTSLTTVLLNDNQSSATNIFEYDATLNPFARIEYSINRGTNREIGTIEVATNGTTLDIIQEYNEVGTSGITITAQVDGNGNVEIRYTSTSTSTVGTFKYIMRSWA